MTTVHPFDEQYFDPIATEGRKSNYYSYVDGEDFRKAATDLVAMYQLAGKKVLDYGCAKGFLVKALRALGVEAQGVDISEYAVNQAPLVVRRFLSTNIDLGRFKEKEFELVLSIDVLEHIPEGDVDHLIEQFYRIGAWQYHQISTAPPPPTDVDVTHVTMKPMSWWVARFGDMSTINLTSSPKE